MRFDKDIVNLSEVDLIKLYRKTSDPQVKGMIFKIFLFEKKSGGKTWDQNIKTHIQNNKYRSSYYDVCLDQDDLYQEIAKNFMKILERLFDISSPFGFGTYAWYVINNSIDRLIQTSRTKKRKILACNQFEINQQLLGQKTKISEVISDGSDGGSGDFQTLRKNVNFEEIFFLKNVIINVKEIFKKEEIEISENLEKELIDLIKQKIASNTLLEYVALKYGLSLEEILTLKQKLEDNLEKEMFIDLINYMSSEVKGFDVLAKKYGCSKGQIAKIRRKLTSFIKSKIEIKQLFQK